MSGDMRKATIAFRRLPVYYIRGFALCVCNSVTGIVQYWSNGMTSAFHAEDTGSTPVYCFKGKSQFPQVFGGMHFINRSYRAVTLLCRQP